MKKLKFAYRLFLFLSLIDLIIMLLLYQTEISLRPFLYLLAALLSLYYLLSIIHDILLKNHNNR